MTLKGSTREQPTEQYLKASNQRLQVCAAQLLSWETPMSPSLFFEFTACLNKQVLEDPFQGQVRQEAPLTTGDRRQEI